MTACDTEGETDAGVDAGGEPDAGEIVEDAGVDAGQEPDAGPPCSGPPGLYQDGSCTLLAVGVRTFAPRYELWADGADKERYISLPPGSQINTSDPDNWVFPVGTRIYKTFLLDGVRLETRLLEKTAPSTGPSAWSMRAFAWNAAQDQVSDVTNEGDGMRTNVLGTEHDIPSGADCIQCHRSAIDAINGFSAIQLNHDGEGLTLQALLDEGALTDPPVPAEATAPGDAIESEALGYLHANCGHCHRYTVYDSPPAGPDCFDDDDRCGTCQGPACTTGLRMWLRVGDSTPADTDTYVTAVGRRGGFAEGDALCRIHPGSPATSTMMVRMMNRGDFAQMPPLATEQAHAAGIAAIEEFILGLTGDSTACGPP